MKSELASLLTEHFQWEGGFSLEEATTAVECLCATALNVKVETTHRIEEARCFLAFSFGGQHDQWLNVALPGPQNRLIGAELCHWYETLKVAHSGSEPFVLHICVQWEIVINSNLPAIIPTEQLHVLRAPVNAMSAKHDHYPTQRLWADMVDVLFANGVNPREVPVGLFAHQYHLPRVAEYARNMGIEKIASSVGTMPGSFDPECAYPWTRDFRGFWLSHVVSAMAKLRNELYCAKPKYFPQNP